MDQLVGVTIQKLHEELGGEGDTVSPVKDASASSCLQCLQLKYKCCLILALTVITFVMLLFSTVGDVLREDQFEKLMTHVFSNVFHNVSNIVHDIN